MTWPIEKLGAGAIVHPNQKEYARTSIQSLSLTAPEQRIYPHTGWRKRDSGWIYLHAGGAIASAGAVSDVNVRLSGALKLYLLSPPAGPDALTPAVAASLRLLKLGPAPVIFSLLAATYRAALGSSDFSPHLVGETGAFKSELAALFQQHYGAGMNRLNLPGTWSSTGNALEMLSFHAKDALLVIDDFAPQGGPNEVSRLHVTADRVLRAAGNHSGRGRLDSNSQMRDARPPRALILSTGEEIPRGQSLRARLLILDLSKGAIDGGRLAECQRDARDGVYAQAMAGFLQWLAGRYEEAIARFNAKVLEYRNQWPGNTHARTPEIVANLRAAFDLLLEFAIAVGAIDASDAAELTDGCQQALCQAAAAQTKYQGESEPTARFLSLLQSVLSSGQAHLDARAGGAPTDVARSCGWRNESGGNWHPLGVCIGWLDGPDLYLDSAAAFAAVQKAARDSGEAFAISETTLRKRLREKRLLTLTDEKRDTLTVRRTIGGVIKNVLHLHRATLLSEEAEDEPENLR
jgi:hypothetical protein